VRCCVRWEARVQTGKPRRSGSPPRAVLGPADPFPLRRDEVEAFAADGLTVAASRRCRSRARAARCAGRPYSCVRLLLEAAPNRWRRRHEHFTLTDTGAKRLVGASTAVAAVQERMLAPFDSEQRRRLYADLAACADALS
jgi:hypothetical protein